MAALGIDVGLDAAAGVRIRLDDIADLHGGDSVTPALGPF
jgi:hypothetical protein